MNALAFRQTENRRLKDRQQLCRLRHRQMPGLRLTAGAKKRRGANAAHELKFVRFESDFRASGYLHRKTKKFLGCVIAALGAIRCRG